MIVIIVLNIIAIIAMLVARRELNRALREIDKLSSARLSARDSDADFFIASSDDNHRSTNS